SWSRRSNRFRFFSCNWALLGRRQFLVFAVERWEATEESIYDSPCVKQVFQRAKGCSARCEDSWLRLCPGGEVCPLRRDQRFTAIRQDQNKNRSIFALHR